MDATLSGLMNRNLSQLQGGYLRASGAGWLCACLALQFLVTSAVWALGGQHELLPGVLLFAMTGMQSAPGRGLAWRILPITRREMALANCWAVAAMPGLALSAAFALAFASNQSEGWPAPSTSSFVLQIVGIWSTLGYIAWLAPRTRSYPGYRGAALAFLTWGIPLLAGFYGYPLGPNARIISIAVMAAGCVLLLLSLLRASRGHAMTGIEVPAIRTPHGAAATRSRAVAPGWRQIIPTAMAQAAMMLALGLGGGCLLRLFYPHATEALLWAFLIGVGLWSILANRRWTQSLWCWRCLPLPIRRLALAVEAVELFPLSLTMLVAWAAGRFAPHTALPLPGWLAAAIVALVAVGNARARIARRSHQMSGVHRWGAYSLSLAYLGCLPAIQLVPGQFQFYWLPELIWVGTSVLLIISFRLTLTQLRSPESIRGPDGIPGSA